MESLVGRTRELAILDEGIRAARAGERSIVLITGEPGIGKTRLLQSSPRVSSRPAVASRGAARGRSA